MATRINKRQADSTRQMIKAKRYIEELDKLIEGKREMSAEQLRAAVFCIEQSIGKAPQFVEGELELTRKWGLKL